MSSKRGTLMETDRNFDVLIKQFEKKIYQTVKGEWRLKLLKEDLSLFSSPHRALSVWDAGCGFGQLSLWLAEYGHTITLCDISRKMLQKAQQAFEKAGMNGHFHHAAAQQLAEQLPEFDVILCHAVIEWLATPLASLEKIVKKVKPGGYVSLLFYNRNAFVFHNALKGAWRWKYLLNNSYLGKGKKLTPPHPQYPDEIIKTLTAWNFSIQQHTGIRVFYDYRHPDCNAQEEEELLWELEYRYCRMPTYRNMGRYIHILAQKNK